MRKAFLRGYFAADGSIETRKNKSYIQISHISFAYHKTKETWLRNFAIKCLKKEGIKNIKIKLFKNKQSAVIRVGKWENFVLFWKMKLFERCGRKKLLFEKIVREMPVYLKLKDEFREKLFKSLTLKQKDVGKIIKCFSEGETSEIIKGNHLLTLERLNHLVRLNKISWKKVINNSTYLRVGQVGYINLSREFIQFILEKKKLI